MALSAISLKNRGNTLIFSVGLIFALLLGVIARFLDILTLPLVLGLAFISVAIIYIFKKPFLGLLFIAFFLPYERIGTIEVSTFTLKLTHIFGAITMVSYFLMMLVKKKITWMKNPIFIPLVIFLVINLLSFTQAVNLFRAITVFSFILFAVLVSILTVNLINSKERLEKIVKVILISTVVVTLFGLFQFLGDLVGLPPSITGLRDLYTKEVFGFPRIHSTALEPLYFANFLLIPLSIALSLILTKKSSIKWYWLALIIILGFVNFILALSRAAYIALAFTLFVIIVYRLKNIFSLKKILSFLIIALIIYMVVLRVFNLTGDFALNFETFTRQATTLFAGASFTDRAETFSQAWTLFKEHPWLGVGVGNFGPQNAWYPLIQPERGWLIVNNEFLEILAETGIFSFVFFLSILAILFFRSVVAIKKSQDEYLKAIMIALLAAFVGVVIQYQTFSILYIIHIWFLFGLMIAVQNLIFAKNKLE